MNLYLLTPAKHNNYDFFDRCVVAAHTAEEAAEIHPSGVPLKEYGYGGDWPRTAKEVIVTRLGIAEQSQKHGIICASFNAS